MSESTEQPGTLQLFGRSSSHFTRVARVFASELQVEHVFRPVFDLNALEPSTFGDNPALKLPVWVDEQGPLFGTENICRELRRRAQVPLNRVVMRGEVASRTLANAEELTLHVMSAEVSLIMAKVAGEGHLAPPKVAPSLHHCLRYLDRELSAILTALPEDRQLSFFEVSLFCVVTHLEFREVADTSSLRRLREFCQRFGERESAKATSYRYDAQ